MADTALDDDRSDRLVARSFVVRAVLEGDDTPRHTLWHGYVADAETGERRVWDRPSDVASFIQDQLVSVPVVGVRVAGLSMAAPAITGVVTDMLTLLGLRLPDSVAPLPPNNVTLERIKDKLVGLGNHRGSESSGPLGDRTLRGGRLDAGVRFQVWASTVQGVDAAMLDLQTAILDDATELRQEGFLRLAATGTTLGERIDAVPGWRKTSTFDVLYEYRYVDTDDAQSLIARIPVTADLNAVGEGRELEAITDSMARWDDELAPALAVRGPAAVNRLAALAFVPVPLGGMVTLSRTSGAGAPVTHLPDLDAFFAATSGATPTDADADVTLAPAAAFAALGTPTPGLEMGDWDTNLTVDAYTAFERRLDEPVLLPTAADRFTVSYTPPPGPSTGLDQTAVVYLRVNPR